MMMSYTTRGIQVNYDSNVFSKEEVEKYLNQSERKIPNLKSVTFRLDGERVACEYVAKTVPFERIRRITGYLTGDLNSWNNAKRAEESERVKHTFDEV